MYERVSAVLGARPEDVKHSEIRQRQEDLCGHLAEDSVCIIVNNPSSIRSRDVHHRHRFNSYLHYLTGWHEEGGAAIFYHKSEHWVCKLYVNPRDIKMETWNGRRPGLEGALSNWPVDETSSLDDIEEDLGEILAKAESLHHIGGLDSEIDKIVNSKFSKYSDPRKIIDEMRVIKSNSEVELMQYAADLASHAHVEAMRLCKPGMGEWHMQSIIEGCFLHHKSHWAYPSIVGCADNATILHYNENKDVMNDGELVLIDAGCEIDGYASDITRTFPVNGVFTEDQKAIYELVLKSQIAGIEACQVGSPWSAMHRATSEILAQGLIDLGILDCSFEEALGENLDGAFRQFFMHGTGHFLGLDVHDVGGGRQGDNESERTLLPGMVVTIEPGLYFGAWRDDISIDARWAGIGIRIEDDILVTENGPVVLTAACPKSIDEIESIVGSA
ncbi:MAG: aminopeptidase P family protein [Candidatus Thalassarchaeaceae archaeon]|nr:aminopeptidase P family protein [Candidatus Thalassarchaeaceae archaeon]